MRIQLIEALEAVALAIDAGRSDLVRYEISRLCREEKPNCFNAAEFSAELAIDRDCAGCVVFDWCNSGVKG